MNKEWVVEQSFQNPAGMGELIWVTVTFSGVTGERVSAHMTMDEAMSLS